MPEQYQNQAVSAAAGSIDNTSNPVTFSVTTGTGSLFPVTTNGPFRIVVMDSDGSNAEVMLVTSRSSDSFTCGRASGATGEAPTPTMLSHSGGSIVSHNFTVGAMDAIRSNIHGAGTYADLPTSGKLGDTYIAFDSVHDLFFYNGTSWDAYIGGMKMTPPNVSMFPTSVNASGASSITFSNTTSGILFSAFRTSGSDNVVGRFQTYPTPPFNARMRFWMNSYSGNYQWMGMAIRDSGSSKMQLWGVENENGDQLRVASWTNETSYNGDANTPSNWMPPAGIGRAGLVDIWITDNGTDRIYEFMPNHSR